MRYRFKRILHIATGSGRDADHIPSFELPVRNRLWEIDCRCEAWLTQPPRALCTRAQEDAWRRLFRDKLLFHPARVDTVTRTIDDLIELVHLTRANFSACLPLAPRYLLALYELQRGPVSGTCTNSVFL